MRGRPVIALWEAIVLAAILAIGAALRLVSLPSRGQWDADQGAHLLAVRALVADGRIPFVGPVTSFGSVHHGALYYDILAPAAWLSGTDPSIVVLTIVLAGLVAVAATWWLARILGGPLAAAIAGALMAVSATEVGASTFIWNPTLLPLGGALAFAGASWAWTARRRAGWLVAALGALIAMQAHLLGSLLLPPLVALWVLDVRRTDRPGARRRLLVVGLGACAILLLGHVQLIANELTTGFSETRAAIAWLTGGTGAASGEAASGLLVRLLVAGIRVLSWPLTGLFVDAYALAILLAGLVLGALAWCRRAARGPTRTLIAWLAATLGWSWLVLALAVPGLATVVRQLPVDHYHAFLDPLVVAIVATAAAAILERAGAPSIARLAATVVVAGLLAWNVATQPPLISPDGGWPAAQRAATRVEAIAHGKPVAVLELPSFKGPDTYVFPLVRDGANVVATAAAVPAGGYVAVVCEDAYRDAIGQACEGRAEDAAIGTVVRVPRLVERFLASPGRHLSVYAVDR